MVHMKGKKVSGSLKENVALKERWWIGQSYKWCLNIRN